MVTPSALGIDLIAFAAAHHNYNNLSPGVVVDFNYRQFLTGTSAATATITVNSASGGLGNWIVDASGNGITTNANTRGVSGALIVSASNGVDPIVSFPQEQWSVPSVAQQGAVRLPRGHGLTSNNQFWTGTGSVVYKNSILPILKKNVGINITMMMMTWSDLEGPTRGDYSKAFAAFDAALADAAAITSHKCYVMGKGWLTYFGVVPTNGTVGQGLPSRTDTKAWPQYVVNNSWVNSFYQNGYGRSQLNFDIDDVWTAYQNCVVAICQRYNNHPNWGGFGFQDETEAISVIDKLPSAAQPNLTQPAPFSSGQTVLNSAHYCTKLEQLFYAMSDASPNVVTYIPWNFLPPGGSQAQTTMAGMIGRMQSSRPGKFLMGGPDPVTHSTTYHLMICGAITGTGDIRQQVAQLSNVEQGTETSRGTPTLAAIISKGIGDGTTPSASPYNTPGRCQIFIWPYMPDSQTGQVDTITPILAAIAANPNLAPNPTVGTYTT